MIDALYQMLPDRIRQLARVKSGNFWLPTKSGRAPGRLRSPQNVNILCQLLPYVEQDAMYRTGTASVHTYNSAATPPSWVQASFWDQCAFGTPSGKVRSGTMKPYICPSDVSMTNGYAATR